MSAASEHWDGSFGNGAGRTNPSVEYVACPYCKARVGKLCIGDYGPKLSTHLHRRKAFQAFRRRHAPATP